MVIGEASYYKRNDGRWVGQIQYKTGSKTQRKYFYGKMKKDVMEKVNYFRENKATYIQSESMLYLTFLKRWLKYKRGNLKFSSFDRLECTVNLHIIRLLGDYEIGNITHDDIIDVLDEIRRTQSFSSLLKFYDALHESFEYAVATDTIIKSPLRAIDRPKKPAVILEEDEDLEDVKCFTPEELERFKNACFDKFKNGKYKSASRWEYIFMLNTGLRLGEMLALTYSDIDLEAKKVYVNKNVVLVQNRDNDGNAEQGRKLVVQSGTKNGKTRSVPLNEKAIEAVIEMKKLNYKNEKSLVVQNELGKHFNPRSYTKRFYTVLKRANLEQTGLHILRHQFATKLFSEQVDLKIISLYLGHSDISTTERIYVHYSNARKELAELKICV